MSQGIQHKNMVSFNLNTNFAQELRLEYKLTQKTSSTRSVNIQVYQPSTQGQELKFTSNSLLHRIKEIISKNLDDHKFSATALCRELNINRNKLQKQVRGLINMKPVELIRYIRLLEARSMLKAGDLNVSEVAYSAGFNNLSYFTKSYKKVFGSLPSAIRS